MLHRVPDQLADAIGRRAFRVLPSLHHGKPRAGGALDHGGAVRQARILRLHGLAKGAGDRKADQLSPAGLGKAIHRPLAAVGDRNGDKLPVKSRLLGGSAGKATDLAA